MNNSQLSSELLRHAIKEETRIGKNELSMLLRVAANRLTTKKKEKPNDGE